MEAVEGTYRAVMGAAMLGAGSDGEGVRVMPIGLLLMPVLLVLTVLVLGFLAVVAYGLATGVAAMTHRSHTHVHHG